MITILYPLSLKDEGTTNMVSLLGNVDGIHRKSEIKCSDQIWRRKRYLWHLFT